MSRISALRKYVAILLLVFGIEVISVVESRAGDHLPWRAYVIKCVDTLIEHGRDQYGPIYTDMLMSIIDIDTLRSPSKPLWLDSEAYYESGRAHRRSMRGSNFWCDQATLRVMYALTELTNDSKYAEAADRNIQAVYRHAVKDRGLIVWGTHIYYDAYTDKPAGDGEGNGPHETLVYHAEWPQLHRVNPEATQRAVDAIWEWHVVDHGNGVPELLEAAKCWAEVIEQNLPPKLGRRWAKEITAALPEVKKTGGSMLCNCGHATLTRPFERSIAGGLRKLES